VYFEALSRRKTDGSVAIDLRANFVRLNLEREKVRQIRR